MNGSSTTLLAAFVALGIGLSVSPLSADELAPDTYSAGVATVDITPTYPVRLNGFGFRRTESEGVTQRIWAKALALAAPGGEPAVLLTVDVCGITGRQVQELAARLEKKAGLKRDRLAVTVTHTHTAPMLTGVLPTIFGRPIPPEHQERIDRYTAEFLDGLEKAALTALANRTPARLTWGVGQVGFAVNRRDKDGPVDHSLPILVVRDLRGRVRAVYVSYACHCTTLSHNQISGDWAGYAQEVIQEALPGAVTLVSAGCGGDIKPSSGVSGDKTEIAARQGAEVAAEVKRLLGGYLAPVRGPITTAVTPLELPLADLPGREEWQERAKKDSPVGYHAQVQVARLDRGEKLATKVDYPVQTWAFGDALAMVFLPGEVVVDYSLRLKRELDGLRLWVNAYSNSVPCYIPSERVLKVGGYEGRTAMTYYDLPGPFKPGLEQKIIDAVHGQLDARFRPPHDPKRTTVPPLSPQQSLATFRTRPGLAVELMAAEPLVVSPVAIDFGPDGRLWVAEMIDYPMGKDGKYQPSGRVRVLEDSDGDGSYDRATVFLDNIPFPTGLTLWRKGVLVCAAPDILYAEDTDGDGKADVVRKLFSGFWTENYQARVNSLHYGLDGWVHGSCGLFGGEIRRWVGGLAVHLGNRDFRLNPDTGAFEPATGRSQQGRERDDWGNWFGCTNSNLCLHFPLADHYLRRNPHVLPPVGGVTVAQSSRLYPVQAQVQRFALTGPPNTPTAACGLGIYRDDLLGAEFTGDIFTCEPVNLLVHRLRPAPAGSTFTGRRAPDEAASEFLAATDTWFRPVQARTGPDGCLWIVDMYRYVIEHPRWIPPDELARVDARAGHTLGRIYRVRPTDRPPRPVRRLDRLDTAGLVTALDSPNGWQRDLAGQMLLWRSDPAAVEPLEELAARGSRPEARLHALCVLQGLNRLQPALLDAALEDPHPGVRRHAVRLAEPFLKTEPHLGPALLKRVGDPDAQVRLQLACSLGEWRDARGGPALAALALRDPDDAYLTTAVLSSVHQVNVEAVVLGVLEGSPSRVPPAALVQRLLGVATVMGEPKMLARIYSRVFTPQENHFSPWQLAVLAAVLEAVPRRGQSPNPLADETVARLVRQMLEQAQATAGDARIGAAARVAAIQVLGQVPNQREADLAILSQLLVPQNAQEVQAAALAGLGRIPADRVGQVVLQGWPGYTPGLRSQALDLLLSREAWQRQLLTSLETSKVSPGHLDAARRERLLRHKDPQFRARADKLFAAATSLDRQKVLDDHQAVANMPGDHDRGKAVFVRVCAACHRLQEVGQQVGPDLGPLLNKTPQYLLQEILDPNRNVDSRFVNYLAVTKAGQTFSGILASESATSITLKGPEGKLQVLLRSDLEEFQSTGKSLMPEGLEKDLSRQDLADVITYIRSHWKRVR